MSQSSIRRHRVSNKGTSGSSDVFDATIARGSVDGITPNTVKVLSVPDNSSRNIYGGGTLIAQDDGAGNLVPEAGHFLAASTIDYATGVVHVEEDGVNNEFNSTYCCIDYSCESAAPDGYDIVRFADYWAVGDEWDSRIEHAQINDPVLNHGRYCIGRRRSSANNSLLGEIYLKKGAGWDTADDVSVAMLWWRTALRTGGASTFADGPHQVLLARYSGLGSYYCGVNHSYGGPWLRLGNAAVASSSLIVTSGNVSVPFPASAAGQWNGLRMDVQTVGSDVRIEVFRVLGSESCDRDCRLDGLSWESQFAVWHRNGVATPEIISGSPTVSAWNKTATHLTGKIGFQSGGQQISTAALSTDKGYISSFQARKI